MPGKEWKINDSFEIWTDEDGSIHVDCGLCHTHIKELGAFVRFSKMRKVIRKHKKAIHYG